MSFDKLQDRILTLKNPTVAGLDARLDYVPEHIRAEKHSIFQAVSGKLHGMKLLLVEKIKGGFFGGDIMSIYFNRITAALNVEDFHLLMPVMRDAGDGVDGIIKGTGKFHIAVFSWFFQSLWRLFHKIRFSFCKYE